MPYAQSLARPFSKMLAQHAHRRGFTVLLVMLAGYGLWAGLRGSQKPHSVAALEKQQTPQVDLPYLYRLATQRDLRRLFTIGLVSMLVIFIVYGVFSYHQVGKNPRPPLVAAEHEYTAPEEE